MPVGNPELERDCLYYGESSDGTHDGGIETDLSGEGTDYTLNSPGDGRWQLSGSNLTNRENDQRTLVATMTVSTSTASGTVHVWIKNSFPNGSDSLGYVSGGNLSLFVNAQSHSIEDVFPDIDGTADNYVVAWVITKNPFATTITDESVSTVHVWNLATGNYDCRKVLTRTGIDIETDNTSRWSTLPLDGAWVDVALFRTAWSSVKIRELYVAQSTAPTVLGETRTAVEVPDRTQVAVWGEQDAFAGPVWLRSLQAAQQRDLATLACITMNYRERSFVDDVSFPDPLYFINEFTNTTEDWLGQDPAAYRPGQDPVASTFEAILGTLFHQRVPPAVTHYKVRMHLQKDTDATVSFRVYSMDGARPKSDGSWGVSFVEESNSDDTGTSGLGGDWIEFDDLLPVVRDDTGMSYFCVSCDTFDDTDRWRTRAITLEPVVMAGGTDGF